MLHFAPILVQPQRSGNQPTWLRRPHWSRLEPTQHKGRWQRAACPTRQRQPKVSNDWRANTRRRGCPTHTRALASSRGMEVRGRCIGDGPTATAAVLTEWMGQQVQGRTARRALCNQGKDNSDPQRQVAFGREGALKVTCPARCEATDDRAVQQRRALPLSNSLPLLKKFERGSSKRGAATLRDSVYLMGCLPACLPA